ncbi:MAG: DUF1080 domain-containing protein [Chlorobi bacterium]|nr:DUF1080 domain-containing protein [Chlorobiota bacterium]
MKQIGIFIFIVTSVLISMLHSGCTQNEWKYLFDGKTMKGWESPEEPASWQVEDSVLVAEGSGSCLWYTGDVSGHDFKNFIFEAEVKADSLANAGILFHTEYSESGSPAKGYECQIRNTAGNDAGRIMTGSLSGIRNLCKSPVRDGEWFSYRISVQGKTIRTWINDILIVDYTEPANPFRTDGTKRRRLDSGTFALVNHHAGSKVRFRNIRVKALPDNMPSSGTPLKDSVYSARLIKMAGKHIPLTDLHIHLKKGLTMEEALTHARKFGFTYGIAFNGGLKMYIETDDSLGKFLNAYQQPPQTWLAMQAEGREWMDMFSKKNISRFDYVFTDAMTWTNDKGMRMRLWMKEETEIGDPEDFMDQLVDRIVRIVSNEPINIYVNATYLPDEIAPGYDELWTEERMDKVIRALVDHHVAMEISARFKIPSATFIKRAKEAGVKFTFGTNNTGPDDLGRLEYCLDMVDDCGLTWQDFWFPDDQMKTKQQ